VAIVGGATAGAEAAGLLAERGIPSVVFEQNSRPFGKIEDGLPRWHVKLRQKEYETISERLSRPGIHFVPLTRIDRDIDFRELATEWGFSAVLLAQGAWRDRPFPVDGAERYVERGWSTRTRSSTGSTTIRNATTPAPASALKTGPSSWAAASHRSTC
jgi:NADPH-dependent glutamate synthase beta subunit-like oxidoreductase